jgi:hypothetical protein
MGELMIRSIGLTPDELLRELRAGRLRAHGPPDVFLRSKFDLDEFTVSEENLFAWIHDPKTPRKLIHKVCNAKPMMRPQ